MTSSAETRIEPLPPALSSMWRLCQLGYQNEPALLILVAPLLAYHKTAARLIALLPSKVPLMEIGINQTWKKQIKVLRRKGMVS